MYRAAARPRLPGGGSPVVRGVRAVVRAVRRFVAAVRALPNPRLTGLGSGLFCTVVMLLTGFLDRLLFGGSGLAYGLLFLPVSALTAVWVRPADLVTAPVAVPIAFAVGTLPISGGTDGFGGQVMGLFTSLAVHAGWLYGGTLIAGVIASVRKIRLMGRKRALRAQAAASSGRPPQRRMPAQHS
ncbi:DUF6542 domain-containing protein [Streptomyces sp. LHD-70]|uniref:DUF6542 domain-containing protein n=1 Tax=Streptomyces sp. LHD-70 TaxID=3072140 RepID=UPI0035BE4AFE